MKRATRLAEQPQRSALLDCLKALTTYAGAGLVLGCTPSRMLPRRILIELTSTLKLRPIIHVSPGGAAAAASSRSACKSSRALRARSALARLCSSALVLQKSSNSSRRSLRLPIAVQRKSVISFGSSFSHREKGVTPWAYGRIASGAVRGHIIQERQKTHMQGSFSSYLIGANQQ